MIVVPQTEHAMSTSNSLQFNNGDTYEACALTTFNMKFSPATIKWVFSNGGVQWTDSNKKTPAL
jgi:hypothetical protein